jgi:murein DD-endopeptidase MepM/ murein hydrolase activator NlpD
MQLIWVSGPAARVVTISITARKVAAAMAIAAAACILVGVLFHFVGLRVAIDYAPALARSLGGVSSEQEQQRMEMAYREQLHTLQTQYAEVVQRLGDIEKSKRQWTDMFGIGSLFHTPKKASTQGQGGPLQIIAAWRLQEPDLSIQLAATQQQLTALNLSLQNKQLQWQDDLKRMAQLPTALPLAVDFQVTSGYGVRADPFTGQASLHEGIDLVAPQGSAVLATASGKVIRSEFSGAYGHVVEVAHAAGYVTRYAHLRERLVKPEQQLDRGEALGLLGNTGRSTGAHLHYEVIYQGKSLAPHAALSAHAKFIKANPEGPSHVW